MHSDILRINLWCYEGGWRVKSIRELREQAKLTQYELAMRLGVTPSTVYGWERRRNEPRASQLKALAQLFEVCMEDIDFEVMETKSTRGG